MKRETAFTLQSTVKCVKGKNGRLAGKISIPSVLKEDADSGGSLMFSSKGWFGNELVIVVENEYKWLD